ncbi:MAG: sugar-binding protein [Bacteroidota bacterium]
MKFIPVAFIVLSFAAIFGFTVPQKKGDYAAPHTAKAPIIDGAGTDACWAKAPWQPINEKWLGEPYKPADFTGRYKAVWDSSFVYILAEITDDTLADTHKDGLVKYWDDDCLEVFFDEDRSKGIHTYSYNAFAYHLSLANHCVDYGLDSAAHYYDSHAYTRRVTKGKNSVWEVRFSIHPDTYKPAKGKEKESSPLKLRAGKKLGFAIAYCDNDRSKERENFIGNVPVAGTDKNKGYIDAGIFGELTLVPPGNASTATNKAKPLPAQQKTAAPAKHTK